MAVTTEKPPALDPLDFLGLDALLDDEERAIRDTVRQFVRDRVLPDIGDWFEQGILPRELIARARRSSGSSGCTSTATGCRARARSPTG